jgi:acyl-coenzyme A thioesterase PaaI-like protein
MSPIARLMGFEPVAGVPLLARGWVTKRGSRVCFADGEITDPEGRKIATASSSCLILRP